MELLSNLTRYAEALGSLVVPIAALVGGWFIGRRQRIATAQSTEANTHMTEQQMYEQMIENLRTAMSSNIDALNAQIELLKVEVVQLHALVGALEGEIVYLGGDPARVRMELSRQMQQEPLFGSSEDPS